MQYLKRHPDSVIAAILCVLVFLSSFLYCTPGHNWDDDFAAYMLEGIAISNGTLEEQSQFNAFMHPSGARFDDVAKTGKLVYVWGFPLILSAIYKLTGFDYRAPQILFAYKLPGIISFAVFAGVLYLFMSKRVNRWLSLLFTMFFVSGIFNEVNQIQTDIPFLCLSILIIYIYELFMETKSLKASVWYAVFLGFSMWLSYAVRLNGFTIILLIAIMQAYTQLRNKECRKALWINLLPYVLFALLYLVFSLLLPKPTSNTADVGTGNLLNGLKFCVGLIASWISEMVPVGGYRIHQLTMLALAAAFVVGLIWKGLRQDYFYNVFLLGTILVNASLPYDSGLRYFFNILPIVLLNIAYGITWMYQMAEKLIRNKKAMTFLSAAAILFACIQWYNLSWIYFRSIQMRPNRVAAPQADAYAEKCLDAYDFVRENTPEDAVFVFDKARVFYLNTGRLCRFTSQKNLDADYYMRLTNPGWWTQVELPDDVTSRLVPIYDNGEVEIYRIQPE